MEKIQTTIDLLNRLITKGQQVVDNAIIERDNLILLLKGDTKIKKKDYSKEIDDFCKKVSEVSGYPSNLLKEFKDYWIEQDNNGKPKFLDKKHKYFDISRRVATFAKVAGIKKQEEKKIEATPIFEMSEEEKAKAKARLVEMRANLLSKTTQG